MSTKPHTGIKILDFRPIPRPEEPIPRLARRTLAVFALGVGLFIASPLPAEHH
jgi:hypothetical protein